MLTFEGFDIMLILGWRENRENRENITNRISLNWIELNGFKYKPSKLFYTNIILNHNVNGKYNSKIIS